MARSERRQREVETMHGANLRLRTENRRLLAALKKIDERTNDPVARSIAAEAIEIVTQQITQKEG